MYVIQIHCVAIVDKTSFVGCVFVRMQDLVEEDVMLLDVFNSVFVWIGRGANQVEKKEGLKTAKQYIETDPSCRDLDSTQLLQVKQGFEPPIFTCHFTGWNPNAWKSDKSYETYLKEFKAKGPGVTSVEEVSIMYLSYLS